MTTQKLTIQESELQEVDITVTGPDGVITPTHFSTIATVQQGTPKVRYDSVALRKPYPINRMGITGTLVDDEPTGEVVVVEGVREKGVTETGVYALAQGDTVSIDSPTLTEYVADYTVHRVETYYDLPPMSLIVVDTNGDVVGGGDARPFTIELLRV